MFYFCLGIFLGYIIFSYICVNQYKYILKKTIDEIHRQYLFILQSKNIPLNDEGKKIIEEEFKEVK